MIKTLAITIMYNHSISWSQGQQYSRENIVIDSVTSFYVDRTTLEGVRIYKYG